MRVPDTILPSSVIYTLFVVPDRFTCRTNVRLLSWLPIHYNNASMCSISRTIYAISSKASTSWRWSTWTHCYNVLRSEEHTSELQSHSDLVCRLLLEKKK